MPAGARQGKLHGISLISRCSPPGLPLPLQLSRNRREGASVSFGESYKRRWQRTAEWQRLRFKILERDGWECQVCHARGYLALLEVDHIDPKGPLKSEENLRAICKSCHDTKSRKEAKGRRRKRKPRPRNAWEIFRDQLA